MTGMQHRAARVAIGCVLASALACPSAPPQPAVDGGLHVDGGLLVDGAGLDAGCADRGAPPVLAGYHLGYRNPLCGTCHQLPRPCHDQSNPWQCAACHGANGACDPTNPALSRVHTRTDPCLGCHAGQHGLAADAASVCVDCHFASQGRVLCDRPADAGAAADAGFGDGPRLADAALASNCFGWPAQPFTSSNHATVQTALPVGAHAIDFALADTSGTAHSLSSLLATRPVLLIFGAFT